METVFTDGVLAQTVVVPERVDTASCRADELIGAFVNICNCTQHRIINSTISNGPLRTCSELVSSPGIAMPPAGLCFTDVTFFFKRRLSHSTTGWTDHNADRCVNTVNEKVTTAINLVNFGPVTPEILWLICMGGEST